MSPRPRPPTLPLPTPGRSNLPDTDTDGDGMPDYWEMQAGLDPNDPLDAREDLDGDGASNRQEYLAGTNVKDPSDHLGLRHEPSLSGHVLSFEALPERSYAVEAAASVIGAAWEPILRVEPGPERRRIEFIISPTGAFPIRFFRVITPAGP